VIVYVLTAVNAVILGVVAYLFYAFRGALDSSGVKQIDDYLHELEGSVAQLTEQFERTSTKISKDLLRKTTELQALIGEADTKLAQASRLRSVPVSASAASREPRRFEAELAEELPVGAGAFATEEPAPRPAAVRAMPASVTPAVFEPLESPAGDYATVEAAAQPMAATQAGMASAEVSRARSFSAAQQAPLPQAPSSAAASAALPSAASAPASGGAAMAASAPAGAPRRPTASELLASKPAPVMRQPAPGAPHAGQAPAAAAANAPQSEIAPQPPAQRDPVQPAPAAALPGQVDARAVAAAAAGTQPNDKYRLIFLLASEGMDNASIAKHTNLTRGEVEMLLDLRRQGKI
jgi:hypothetical protein